ncbi:MAG: DUF2029 domain-containing protein [Phycisphaera sp.]|nr:DUF2029 domain-containing protein [Phycisphaera sp.]
MSHPMVIAFAVTVALAAAVGVWGAWRLRRERAIEALIAIAAPVGVVLVGWIFYTHLAANVAWSWNDIRLAPSYFVTHGVELYPAPDAGPIIGWVYGPMTAYAYTPATLAPTPTAAIVTAIVISGLLTSLSVWLVLQTSARTLSERFVMTLAAVGFVAWAMDNPQSKYAMTNICADAPSLGLGVIACSLLLAARRQRHRTRRHTATWIAAAACAALATWSKQIEAPLVVALPLFVLIDEGWRRALRFGVIQLIVGVVASIAMVAPYDPRGVWFCMFELTGGSQYRTWKHPGMSPFGEASLLLGEITWVWAALLIVAVAAGWWTLRRRTRRPLRLMRRHPAVLFVIVAVLLIPLSILGMAKVGGFYNSMHTAFYVQVAAWVAIGSLAMVRHRPRFAVAVKAVMLIAIGWKVAAALPEVDTLPGAAQLADNPTERGAAFVRAHPGEVYLPYHPLATYFAEHAVYHNGYGLFDRRSYGRTDTPEYVRAYLPPHLRYIARQSAAEHAELDLLPEFNRRIEAPELPGWEVWVRGDDPLVAAPPAPPPAP